MSGCDVLYRQFFVRWCRLPPGTETPSIVRGDLETYEGAEGTSAIQQCRLPAEQQDELARQVETMVGAARADWPSYLQVEDAASLEALDIFDRHWSRPAIASLIRRSDPADFANDYLVVTCELGAVMGFVMRALRPELEWIYRSPYWESSLWHSGTATVLPVFHWAIKRMSAYGAEDGLRPKLLFGVEQLTAIGRA